MKINTLRNLMLFGVAALPLAANAAAPVPFGSSFTTLNGSVDTYTCPTGFSCGANPIVDDGFMQVTMTEDATGETYFQTIVLGGSTELATETFSTESFVKVGATGNAGIAVNQVVDDFTGGNFGTLESYTEILTGEFLGAGEDTVVLTQNVTDAPTGIPADAEFQTGFTFNAEVADLDGGIGGVNDRIDNLTLSQTIVQSDGSFDDSFGFQSRMENVTDAAGNTVNTVTDKRIDIETQVDLGTGVTDQVFNYNLVSGTLFVPNAGTATVQAAGAAIPVDWAVGDTVDRVLIGQHVAGAGDFGFASFANQSDIAAEGVISDPADPTGPNFGSAFTLVDNTSAITYVPADPFL